MDGLEALRKENAELRAQVAQLLTELARLNDRVSELLAVAQRKQRKAPAPGAAAPAAAPPVVEGEAQRAFEERPKAPDKPAAEPPPKKKARPTGRKPIPSHLEAEEHELRPDACGECGGAALDVVDELVEEKLHVVKEHQRRRVVRRYTCRCRECGERTTLRSLPAPYERSKVTCEWLAWLVYQKFWLLTPLDRIRRDLAERGVPIAMSTLVTFIERAADLLSGIDGLHWKQLLAGSWMATDGTGLKVIIKKLPAAHNGYVELYRNHDVAVFQYEPDKSGEVVAAKLRPFRGTLTADAEHRFNDVFASGRVLEAGCNAHGRRKFRDAEDTQPVLALEGGAFLGAIYGEEGEAQKLGLVGEALREHRQRCIRPIVQDFERWRDAVEPTLLPSEPLAAAIRYYKNHRDALFRFVDDPLVPIDNSPTEREFQNVAKLRLNMLFAGSTEGAHRACVLLGIIATCRALGVPAQAYLTWAFERLGTHRDVFALPLEALTPAAFKKTLG
ncbi:MAG: IS66 family transposase [Polyangiaceae bacterium]|nr:IS66 family transposase [Polyangiaceae bacterium]MCL4703488.1 IS66 family transposase [Burkholderiaceae bacterium]MBE7481001.1 IS66 family transposase [Polyangiaceae bacterium]MBE7481543.1 IS66 family transposase [Polyangiaceae bacterium]MBE7482368.1 IS66 family transposase [Polyangiaceae bacterium]